MPPVAVHAITGIAISSLIDNPYWKLGAIGGSLLPDADLLVASAGYLVTGKIDTAKKIHRTFTHSLFVHGAIAVSGLLFHNVTWGIFLIIFAATMTLHVAMDYLYFGFMSQEDVVNDTSPGVALLAPLTMKKFILHHKVLSDRGYQLFLVTDYLTDPILYYAPLLYFAWYFQTDQQLWWPLVAISIIYLIIIVGFLFAALLRTIALDKFTVYLYYVCVPCLLLSLVFPFLCWETVQKLHW